MLRQKIAKTEEWQVKICYFCVMNQMISNARILVDRDWATLLFVVCFILIAVVRAAFEKRFSEFLRLAVSDKYLKIYRDPSYMMSGFTILLFLVQVLSLSFFILLTFSHFGYAVKTDYLMFIRIFTLLFTFILSRFLIDKIIAVAFNIEEVMEQFNLSKVSYRTYIALALMPVNIILFYSKRSPELVFLVLIVAILIMNVLTYMFSLKNYQNFIGGKLFYFILYLCALEIAPYYFMYYWFTNV